MTRPVEHHQTTPRGCACGARFPDVHDLRRHITRANRETKRTKRTR